MDRLHRRQGRGRSEHLGATFRRLTAPAFLAALVLCGCVHYDLRHADLAARAPRIKRIVVLSTNVQVFELTTGGLLEWRGDWSEAARVQVLNAATKALEGKSITATALGPLNPAPPDDALSLYDVVDAAIFERALPPRGPFSEETFIDYSIGEIAPWLDAVHADAMLVLNGSDETPSVQRGVAQAALVMTGALMGRIVTPRHPEKSVLSLSLVDRRGDVLWHVRREGRAGMLMNTSGRDNFVAALLRDLQLQGP